MTDQQSDGDAKAPVTREHRELTMQALGHNPLPDTGAERVWLAAGAVNWPGVSTWNRIAQALADAEARGEARATAERDTAETNFAKACRSLDLQVSRLEKLEALVAAQAVVIVAADEMRSWYRKQMDPDGPEVAYDAAKAELEKVTKTKGDENAT